MSEEHKDGQDVNELEKKAVNVEKVEEKNVVEKEVTKETLPKKKRNVPLVAVSSVVLGALALYAGSSLGTLLGTPNAPESDTSAAVEEAVVEEEVVAWKAAPLIDGEPKLNPEDVIDRSVAPWSDGYKLDDTHLDYLTADEFEAKIDSGERFVIYIGRATCPYCHEYRQLQDKALSNLGETIYSVDTEYYKNNEKIAELRENLDVEFVPDVVVIENGKATTHLPEEIQVSSVEGVTEWFEGILN